jgi:ribosomal protein S27E
MHKTVTDKTAVTTTEYTSFQVAFDWFNKHLFADATLPNVLITLQRKARSKGYFSADRFSGRKVDATVHELALNPDVFPDRSDEEILSTLVHEMCHLWQATHGKSPRSGYHDVRWGQKMESVGLIPSSTGEVGGKKTGQRVTHFIKPGGPFQLAYQALQETGFVLSWQSAEDVRINRPRKKSASSKTKFSCPECHQNVWGKPDASVTCGVCYAEDETIVFMIPAGACAAGVGGDDD